MTQPPPLARYRGAVLACRIARKPTRCASCREFIAAGSEVWFPLVENRLGGVLRFLRWHARHFVDGDQRTDPRP